MFRILAAAVAASVVLTPLLANANSCAPRPTSQLCEVRLPKAQTLDLRQPGAGGSMTCKGIPSFTVQFDNYYFASSGYVYFCTMDIPCSQLVGTLPHQRFC